MLHQTSATKSLIWPAMYESRQDQDMEWFEDTKDVDTAWYKVSKYHG